MRKVLSGHGASRGSALGRARVRQPHVLDIAEERIDASAVDAELARMHAAVDVVREEMRALRQRLHGALAQEVGEFLDPGCGVVEGGEQGRVAAAVPGGSVGLGEQEAGLLDGEVVDGRLRLPFGGDGEDVLAGGHPGGVLRLYPAVERADRG